MVEATWPTMGNLILATLLDILGTIIFHQLTAPLVLCQHVQD